MQIEQFVLAYGVEHDRLRAIPPEGYASLRPVLRVNAELRDGAGYLELNTAVERGGLRGWLNIGFREHVSAAREGNRTVFRTDALEIAFTATGIAGDCPAERDNGGCFFPGAVPELRAPEVITAPKEFCDCSFRWLTPDGAHGESCGKTLPAVPVEVRTVYPRQSFSVRSAAAIPCTQVLGAYCVRFSRE